MQITTANIRLINNKLAAFAGRKGFPTEPAAVENNARAILRFVHGKRVNEIVKMEHPEIHGNPIDIDWLMDEATDQIEDYPQPVQLRQIYQEFLPPADGKEYFTEKKK